jgi:hypothetical protein
MDMRLIDVSRKCFIVGKYFPTIAAQDFVRTRHGFF